MLKDLKFIDLYLGQSASWLTGVPERPGAVPVPEEHEEELAALRERCRAECERTGLAELGLKADGVAYRLSVLEGMYEIVYVLRRFPDRVPLLEDLGIHPQYCDYFMTPDLNGLIVVAGAYAQGKTTTASSIVVSRLNTYGGVAVTIEEPREMPLEGRHGPGVCYQTQAKKGQFGDSLRNAARWAPNMLFVGEVRDSETANEALRASINGRLVVCTTHAESAPVAVERLFSLACAQSSNTNDVAYLLASGLRGVLFQELEGIPKRPKTEMLWLGGPESHGATNAIRRREWGHLQNEVDMQLRRLRNGGVA